MCDPFTHFKIPPMNKPLPAHPFDNDRMNKLLKLSLAKGLEVMLEIENYEACDRLQNRIVEIEISELFQIR